MRASLQSQRRAALEDLALFHKAFRTSMPSIRALGIVWRVPLASALNPNVQLPKADVDAAYRLRFVT